MHLDFEASAGIKHSGSKGTFRENTLRSFLSEGRLPSKYGIGSGEIVGRVRDTSSRQCDVVIYDHLNGVKLLYDDSIQVFPIDCVYGIIEVKSGLSKTEFIDSLEKIKVFKSMAPTGCVSQSIGGGFTVLHSRPQPFGIVFAYSLAGNSLNSLLDNLREWEAKIPAALWPNYVCVLNVGVIYHQGKVFETCLDSDQITDKSWPIAINHEEDSLFKFYCALHDMCAHMQLGPVELTHYYDPPLQIGTYVVHGRGIEGTRPDNEELIRITESAICKIVSWCSTNGTMQYGDVLKNRFGSLPLGMENMPQINMDVFLYNPDNLPGMHQVGQSLFTITDNNPTMVPCLASAFEWIIDGKFYVVASQSLTEKDYENVGGL